MVGLKERVAGFASTALGAGGLLALGLIAGRLSGLLREIVLAAEFGVSAQADFAIVLLTLPDLLTNLLISGGLSAAFIPRARVIGVVAAGALFRTTAFCTVILFTLLAVLLSASPGTVLGGLAPGLAGKTFEAYRLPIVLVAISLPVTALSGATGAYLNARDRFFIVGMGTFIFNLAIIGGLLASERAAPLVILGCAILAGGILRSGSQLVLLPPGALSGRPRLAMMDKDYVRAFVFGVLASTFALAPPALVRAAASLIAPGFIAIFNYSQKIVELPIGILATSVSTIALTRLSQAYAEGNENDAERFLYGGLRLAFVLSLLILIFGMFATDAGVRILYGRGAIEEGDIREIARLTRIIFLGLPFVVFNSILAAALNARRQTGRVLIMTGGSFALLCILVIPAIAVRSADLLMLAMVASQACLCVALGISARVRIGGPRGVLNEALATVVLVASGLAFATVCLALEAGIAAPWQTVLIAGGGFAIAGLGAYRTARQRELLFGGRKDATDVTV